MTAKQADLLLLLVIASRSTSYLFSKIGLAGMTPWNLLGVRFTLTFLILCLLFHGRLRHLTRQTVRASVILGGLLFACMGCEMVSLETIDSSMAAMLENTAVVWVILLQAVINKHRPPIRTVIVTVIIVTGIFFLTMKGNVPGFSTGELICLCGSFCYAGWIILTSRFTGESDPILLGILQMGILGIGGLTVSAGTGTIALPPDMTAWAAVLALIFICSVFGFTFQPLAQKYTGAEKAGLFTAVNPLIAAALGWIFLSEILSPLQILGGILVIVSILAVQIRPSKLTCQTNLTE